MHLEGGGRRAHCNVSNKIGRLKKSQWIWVTGYKERKRNTGCAQRPNVEQQYLVFSMLNASTITHHDPTALTLFLSLRESLMPAELQSWLWHMEGDGGTNSADVKCDVSLIFCVPNFSQVSPSGALVGNCSQILAKQEILQCLNEHWHAVSSDKSFQVLGVIWAFSLRRVKSKKMNAEEIQTWNRH